MHNIIQAANLQPGCGLVSNSLPLYSSWAAAEEDISCCIASVARLSSAVLVVVGVGANLSLLLCHFHIQLVASKLKSTLFG